MLKDSSSPQRVVVNATPLLGNLTGVGQVTATIARYLENRDDFQLKFHTPFRTYGSVEEVCSPLLELRLARRVITTVHDMSFREYPEWHPADRVNFFAQNFTRNIDRSDIVVTVSQFTRDRFLDAQSEVREDRLRVIPCGVDLSVFQPRSAAAIEVFRKRLGLPRNFILCVGSIEPRKNLSRLLEAFAMLPPPLQRAYPLVLVGSEGWKNSEIRDRVKKMSGNVRVIPYISDPQELVLMYNASSLFVYPSLYEGFGIPPLEAMACGTPVCLSDIPVFREICPADTACFFDPLDPEAIAAGLQQLLEDSTAQEQLRPAGEALARRFPWKASAQAYASLFQELRTRPT